MLISPAYAQAAGGGGSDFFVTLMPLVLIFVVFYFLLIRPQQKRMKDHKAMIAAVRRGDTVITGGGIVGKVSKVKDDDTVQVEIADGIRINVIRDTLSSVRSKTEPASDKGDAKPAVGGGGEQGAKAGGLFSKLKR